MRDFALGMGMVLAVSAQQCGKAVEIIKKYHECCLLGTIQKGQVMVSTHGMRLSARRTVLRSEWKNTGLWLVIPDEHNRREGYGLEALGLIEQYIFDSLAYQRIAVRIAECNQAAVFIF